MASAPELQRLPAPEPIRSRRRGRTSQATRHSSFPSRQAARRQCWKARSRSMPPPSPHMRRQPLGKRYCASRKRGSSRVARWCSASCWRWRCAPAGPGEAPHSCSSRFWCSAPTPTRPARTKGMIMTMIRPPLPPLHKPKPRDAFRMAKCFYPSRRSACCMCARSSPSPRRREKRASSSAPSCPTRRRSDRCKPRWTGASSFRSAASRMSGNASRRGRCWRFCRPAFPSPTWGPCSSSQPKWSASCASPSRSFLALPALPASSPRRTSTTPAPSSRLCANSSAFLHPRTPNASHSRRRSAASSRRQTCVPDRW